MATVIAHRKFVCSDALNNNNKFWEFRQHDDGTVIVSYGRVGKTSTTDPAKVMSQSELDTKIREKLKARGKEGTPTYKPPYREITVVAGAATLAPTGPKMAVEVVREAAKQQLSKGNSELAQLVERLVIANKHELVQASGGQMDVDVSTGIISTPIGVITKDTVKQARIVLDALAPLVNKQSFDDKKFIEELNSYLMLVPQKVGHARGWHRSFFNVHNTTQSQSSLLDQLDASAELAEARVLAAKNSAVQTTLSNTPNLFNTDLSIVTDKEVIKKIEKMFFDTINDRHESRNLRPIKFYEVKLTDMHDAYQTDGAKLTNQMLLWHGTRMFNVLSILKSGLMLPKTLSTMQIAGAMFGNGLYFSDQSTKSLNYAYGYWDGRGRDTNCFMLLVDVALGKSYIPKSSHETLPKKDHDSTFAKPGVSGIMNNEYIVYRRSQANIRYLVEFDKK